jgi:tetratricopeptide (TPR) repeat protein
MSSGTFGKSAVAVFVFNRPAHVARLMSCIESYKPSELLIIADGPRDQRSGEALLCEETRKIALSLVTWPCQVKTHFSDVNLGCGLRLSSGLDWVFAEVSEAIILEDDCLPSKSFFFYCEALLEKYRDVSRVMHIGGYRVSFDKLAANGAGQTAVATGDPDYFFSDMVHVWGWATWRRAWHYYDFSLQRWPEIRDSKKWVGSLSLNTNYWIRELDKIYDNKPHTWDHQWGFACWLNEGVAIVPRINLVQNIGFENGAHGARPWNPLADNLAYELSFPLHHPASLTVDVSYNQRLQYWLFSKRRYGWYLMYWLKKFVARYFGVFLFLFFLCFFSTSLMAESDRLLEYFYRGKTATVIQMLEKDGVDSEAGLLLANAYYKEGRFADAEKLLDQPDYQTLELQPFIMLLRLQLAVNRKSLSEAQRFYAVIVARKGESDFLALRGAIEIARCLIALDQKEEATVLLRNTLRKTDNPEIQYLVEALFFDLALAAFDKDAAKKALKAMCLTGARWREEASFFKQFRLRFGEDVPSDFVFSDDDAVLNRATLFVMEGRYQDAIGLLDPWLKAGIVSKSSRLDLQYLLAQTYALYGEYTLATSAFERILLLEDVPVSIYWDMHLRLVEGFLRTQFYEEALRYIKVLQSGPMAYRAAGQALYIQYLIDIQYPAEKVLSVAQAMQKNFPKSPDVKTVAMDAWYYGLVSGHSPMPDPPISSSLAAFFASWRPKHIDVVDKHILESVPLSYTALALLEATQKQGTTIPAYTELVIRTGFGQFLLAEKNRDKGYKAALGRAKVLNLMERPYQSITLLRSHLLTAPRDASLWTLLDRDWVQALFPRLMVSWAEAASARSVLEPNLILAVIRMESTFNAEIKSKSGALGLMQLMPKTAREMAHRLGSRYQGEAALLDPAVNIMLGSFYLSEQLRLFKGNLVLALAAYNVGPATVRRWIILNPDLEKTTGRAQIALLPYAETRNYVSGVLDSYAVYSYMEKQGY